MEPNKEEQKPRIKSARRLIRPKLLDPISQDEILKNEPELPKKYELYSKKSTLNLHSNFLNLNPALKIREYNRNKMLADRY